MKSPKILLTGTYSSFNKGDAAMLIAASQRLKTLFPKCEIVASVPFLEREKQFYHELDVIKSSRRNLILGTVQIFRAWVYKNFRFKSWFNNQEMEKFLTADLVLDISGDGLSEDYGPHVAVSHFLPICLALALGKPVFILPQSIGPFRLTRGFAKRQLNRVDIVTAREELTYKYLRSNGINKNKLVLAADLAFLLKPTGKARAKQILKQEKISIGEKPLLGVTVSNLVERRFNKNAATDQDFISEIAGLLDKLIDKKDLDVILIGHVTGPSRDKNDRLVAERVRQKMKNAKRAFVLQGDYRPEDLKAVIGLCDVFLGSRMHSNIGALSSCVPTVAIGYSQKTEGIMSLLEMNDFVHHIDQLDIKALEECILKAFANKKALSKKLDRGVAKLKSQAESSFESVTTKVKSL